MAPIFRMLALARMIPRGRGGRRGRRRGGIPLMLVVAALYYAQSKGWISLDGNRREAPPVPEAPAGFAATVSQVIDGDTLDVRRAGGETQRVRIKGIDCPETHNQEKAADQARRWELAPDQVLALGETAKAFARDQAQGLSVRVIHPGGRPEFDDYDRLLAYLEVPAGDLGALLLAEGLAEARREPHPRKAEYQNLESAARRNRLGLFRDSDR